MLTLVTGATGFVGNNVVRLLLERGAAVRAMAREQTDSRPLEGLDVEVIRGNVRDDAAVERAVAGVDRVVHAAAIVQIGWSGLDEQRAVNVEGTRRVAAAARKVGARMVHVSSCDAVGIGTAAAPADEETPTQGNVLVPYVVTKREAERALQAEVERGLDAVIVNPAFMLGPWDWRPSSGQMLVEVARGKGLFAPPGVFSVCDVRDVADGILSALERGQRGRRYILAGHNLSYLDAWRLFAEGAKARRPLACAGGALSWLAGQGGNLVWRVTGREPNVNSGAIAMARLPKYYSSARAEAELGYRVRPIRETITDAVTWFRKYGYL